MKLTIMAVAHLPKAKQIYILQLPSLRYTCSKHKSLLYQHIEIPFIAFTVEWFQFAAM